jgi:transposase-like protein
MQPDATLSDRQARAATLEAMGHTTAEIAATMDVHRATVFRWRKGKAYREHVASVAEDAQRVARTSLEYAARDAALRLCSLLQAEDSRVALRAAIAILDRTGHGPAQRIDLTATERYPVAERADAAEELARLLSGMDAAAK